MSLELHFPKRIWNISSSQWDVGGTPVRRRVGKQIHLLRCYQNRNQHLRLHRIDVFSYWNEDPVGIRTGEVFRFHKNDNYEHKLMRYSIIEN